MSDFLLDPILDRDTLPLGDLPLSRVLLMNDARYVWLLLVPRRPDLAEFIDLAPAERHRLMDEIAIVSDVLKAETRPDKINVGALGNKVRQLHVHVLSRFLSDPAWPGPVWGHSPAIPYPPHRAGILCDSLCAALARHGLKEI